MIRVLLSKGRIADNFLDTLVEKNVIDKKPNIGRLLKFRILNMDMMLVRSSDISTLLDTNSGDIAIVGSDVIEEKYNNRYPELYDFNEEKCKFVLAGLPETDIESVRVIATKYPNISKRYLESMKKKCEIIKMNGCLELYPNIGLCDAIIDIVESGRTLDENGLIILKRFEQISTRIITTKEKESDKEIKKLINKLR